MAEKAKAERLGKHKSKLSEAAELRKQEGKQSEAAELRKQESKQSEAVELQRKGGKQSEAVELHKQEVISSKRISRSKRLLQAMLRKAAVIIIAFYIMMASVACGDDLADMDTVDLTNMSSTLVFAYINDMMNARPEKYLGKTIKARGDYYTSFASSTENYYHFILISDALACCEQGLEFKYEGEYPEVNANITITGTFDKYIEQNTTYYFINTENISIN